MQHSTIHVFRDYQREADAAITAALRDNDRCLVKYWQYKTNLFSMQDESRRSAWKTFQDKIAPKRTKSSRMAGSQKRPRHLSDDEAEMMF